MNYFFKISFFILFVILVIMDVAKHLLKKKLIESILHPSTLRRQAFTRMDSSLVSYERILFWLLLAILPLLALTTYYFLPHLLYLPIVMALFCPFVLEDYLYRKSFLKAIEKL